MNSYKTPAQHISDSQRREIIFGPHSIGDLLATLPSLMGFRPTDSLILLGLQHNADNPSRCEVGPLVRCDLYVLDLESMLEEAFQGLSLHSNAGLIVIMISEEHDKDHNAYTRMFKILGECQNICEARGIPIQAAYFLPRCETGAEYYDVFNAESGTQGDINNNPIATHQRFNSVKTVTQREEIEEWISAEDCHTRSQKQKDLLQKKDRDITTEDILRTAEYINVLREYGEEECQKNPYIDREEARHTILRLCLHDTQHALVIFLSCGSAAPIMREELAYICRHTKGVYRHRVLLLLSLVLFAHDEGFTASIVLNRCCKEISEMQSIQDLDYPEDLDPIGRAEENENLIQAKETLTHFMAQGLHRAMLDNNIPQVLSYIIELALCLIAQRIPQQSRGTHCVYRMLDTIDWKYLHAVYARSTR